MQAAQCNWRIVKDWKNSLFTFFTKCYFSDRDAFNSLIPYLGKNISFPVIGRLKNPAWFLGCRVPLYWNRVLGEWLIWKHHPTHFFAAYWLTSVFCGRLLTNTYTKKLLNSDWLRKECSSSVTRVQTCNTTANYKWSLIGWKHKRTNQIRADLTTNLRKNGHGSQQTTIFRKQNNNRKVKKIFQKPEHSKKYVFLAKWIENSVLREKYSQQNRGKWARETKFISYL